MVSDTAKACPKCGSVLKNTSGNSLLKWMIVIGSAAVLLIVVGIVYFVMQSKEEKAAAEQAAAEKAHQEAVYAQKCDSIYKNFTSKDLLFADVKGCVKSVEVKLTQSTEYDKHIEYRFLFVFDKAGKIIDVQSKYLEEEKLIHSRFSRDADSTITAISTREDYTTGGGDSYKIVENYTFQYDDNGHVKAMGQSISGDGGRGGMRGESSYSFTQYEEGKGFLGYNLTYDDGFGPAQQRGTFSNVKLDDRGNWISKSCVGQKREPDPYGFGDSSGWEKCTLTQERTISYYDKPEIDFSKFMQ